MPSPALPPPLAARRRRARWTYAVVVVVLLLGVGLTMGVVIGTGEAAHATLRTSAAAAAVPGGTVRPEPTVVWRTDDNAAGGSSPLSIGTVITWSEHRLAGRDATTGDVRWSYTRTDLSICDAAQYESRAYVLFRRDGDCDELSTFDASTGARSWFRTLSDTGEGRLEFGSAGLVVTYAMSFHVINISNPAGVDRFPSVPTTGSDCRFTAVVPGATGIIASEICADGTHLALWSNLGAESQPQRLWRVGVTDGVTAVAQTTVGGFGYDPVSGALSRYAAADGAAQTAVTLDPATTGPAGPTLTVGSDVVLDLGDRAYDVSEQGVLQWSVASVGPAGASDANGGQVFVPTSTGAALVDVGTGATQATYTLPAASDSGSGSGSGSDGGPRVYGAGSGLLVAGPGLTYLR